MSIEDMKSEQGLEVDRLSFLDTLADELAGTLNSVFGPVVERDGVTVIPVAKARWGMGGGLRPYAKSESERGAERGVGGGGGAMVKPIGFIELVNGKAKFRSIREPISTASAAVATGILSLVGAGVVASLRRPGLRARFKMRKRGRRLSNLFQ